MNKKEQEALDNFNNCGHAIKTMINTITMTVECPMVEIREGGVYASFQINEFPHTLGIYNEEERALERSNRMALFVASRICNGCPFAKLSPNELKEIKGLIEANVKNKQS
jgi:hypothetical protein